MSAETWPSAEVDPLFVAFARKVADVVTVAINSGKKVGRDEGCRCPIGCHPQSAYHNPGPTRASHLFQISHDACWAFMCGFDGKTLVSEEATSPYFSLGAAYRRRFVERAP